MKNIFLSALLILGFAGLSYADSTIRQDDSCMIVVFSSRVTLAQRNDIKAKGLQASAQAYKITGVFLQSNTNYYLVAVTPQSNAEVTYINNLFANGTAYLYKKDVIVKGIYAPEIIKPLPKDCDRKWVVERSTP